MSTTELTALEYAQLIQNLCYFAETKETSRFPVPINYSHISSLLHAGNGKRLIRDWKARNKKDLDWIIEQAKLLRSGSPEATTEQRITNRCILVLDKLKEAAATA